MTAVDQKRTAPRLPIRKVTGAEFWFRVAIFVALFVYCGFIFSLLLVDALLPFWSVEASSVPAVLRFWHNPIARAELIESVRLSVATATVTALLAALLGIPTAYALSRFRFPGAVVVDTVVDLLIVIPPLIVGLTLVAVFGQTETGKWLNDTIGFLYTPQGIVVAQFAVASALAVRVFKAAFDQVNPRFEQVARSLGASPLYAFFRITLPLAKNGLLAGLVLAWARAIGEFAPVLVVAGTDVGKVLPVQAFLNMSAGNVELAFVVTTLMMLISATALLTFKRLGGQVYIW
jgi:molybdate transport system permease protein